MKELVEKMNNNEYLKFVGCDSSLSYEHQYGGSIVVSVNGKIQLNIANNKAWKIQNMDEDLGFAQIVPEDYSCSIFVLLEVEIITNILNQKKQEKSI